MYRTERFKFDERRLVVAQSRFRDSEDYLYHTTNGCWKITCHWPATYESGRQWVYGGCHRKQCNGKYKLMAGWDMYRDDDEIHRGKNYILPQYIMDVCKKLAERMFEGRDKIE